MTITVHKNHWEAEQAQRADAANLVVVPVDFATASARYARQWGTAPKAEAEAIFAAVRAKYGELKIELRNVKFAAFNSEETNCFSADVFVNGKREGYCHNEGHGGPTTVEPWALADKLDVYGAAQPPHVTSLKDDEDPSGHFTMTLNAEHICDFKFEEWQKAKDAEKVEKKLQRDLRDRVVFTVKGKKGIWHTNKMDPARLKEVVSKRMVKDADVILNTLPFDEAKKVYDANITVTYR